MRYFLRLNDEGLVSGWVAQESGIVSLKKFIEVDINTFKRKLLELGHIYLTTEDKMEILEIENANLILNNEEKDLKIKKLEEENANLILLDVEKELRLAQTEEDVANLLLVIGGM